MCEGTLEIHTIYTRRKCIMLSRIRNENAAGQARGGASVRDATFDWRALCKAGTTAKPSAQVRTLQQFQLSVVIEATQ